MLSEINSLTASPVSRGPLYRQLTKPRPAADEARFPRLSPAGVCRVWVVNTGHSQTVTTLFEDAEAVRDNWNEHHMPDPEEAGIRGMTAIVVEDQQAEARPGCRYVAMELPGDLLDTLAARCADVGLEVSRLVSALMYNHINQMTPEKTGEGVIRAFSAWETGRRRFREWPVVKPEAVQAVETERITNTQPTPVPVCFSYFDAMNGGAR